MRKSVIIIIGILFTLFSAACKQYNLDVESYLQYWSAEAYITSFTIKSTVYNDTSGIPNVPSAQDVSIICKLHNPESFLLDMPPEADRQKRVIVFDHLEQAPVINTDYTLTQSEDRQTITLTYKASFLQAHEWGTKNLSSALTLYAKKDGRKFRHPYTFQLKANTPPPDLTYRSIGKTATPDANGKYYYVLFFEAKGMDAKVNSLPLHKDIANLSIAEGSGAYSAVPLKYKEDGSGFDISGAAGTLLEAGETAQLVPADIEGSGSPDALPSSSEKWILRVKTNAEVLLGIKKQYRLRLQDTAGLSSIHEVVTSTSTNKVKPIDITVQSGYLAAVKKSGTETDPHEIIYQSNVEKIVLLAQTPTDGAEIHYTLERDGSVVHKQSGITPLTIEMPAVSGAVYKLRAWAVKNGFDTSPEIIVYYKTTFLSGREISSGPRAWTELKTAVAGAADGDVFFINGTIQATADGNYGEISITKKIAIKGKNGNAETTILDANKAGLGTHAHRIFTIKNGGELTLENLTLTNGKVSGTADGGAVQIENGGTLTMSGCTIQHCESEGSGGGIYTAGTLTVNGGMVGGEDGAGNYAKHTGGGIFIWHGHCTLKDVTIQGNTVASSGRAAGVFLKQSDSAVLTIEGNTKIGTADDPASNSVYLDRQDSSKSACISAGILGTAAHINVQPDNYLGQRDKPLVKGTALSTQNPAFKLVNQPSGEEWELRANAADTELVLSRAALTITSGTGAWLRLKQAVEDAKDGDVITISGTIQATKDEVSLDGIDSPEPNSGEIEVTKHITIKGKSGTAATDVLDANSSSFVPGSVTNKPNTAHRIFKVTGSNAALTLENLTLKNGNAAGTFGNTGGAAFLTEGSRLRLKDVDIEHCEAAQNGGAISIEARCRADMEGGSIRLNTVAAGGSGSGVLLNTESVFNMSGSAQVAADNDVYLAKHDSDVNKHAKITVAGVLSQPFAAKITLHSTDYTAGRIVVQGSEASGETPYQLTEADIHKFDVTPNTVTPNEVYKWTTQLKGNALELARLIDGSTENAWAKLKTAVASAGANETIVIQGMVKATNAPGNSSEIEITRNITIKGISGTAADDGLDANSNDTTPPPADQPSAPHRILKVTGSDTTLTLKNVTLKNGRATGSGQNSQGGGILVVDGTLVMNGCTVTGCKAEKQGGGIYLNGGTCTFSGSMSGNTAQDGGGIAVHSAKLIIEPGCTIGGDEASKGNKTLASGKGGGIYVGKKAVCTIKEGVTIQHNTAKVQNSLLNGGGGIYVGDPDSTEEANMGTLIVKGTADKPVNIKDCIINDTFGAGGGIYSKGKVTLTHVHISGCKALMSGGLGGGIYVRHGQCTLIDSEVSSCEASAAGGGVYVYKDMLVGGLFTMKGSTRIVPSGDNRKGNNDIFLKKDNGDTYITLSGELTGEKSLGRITVPDMNYNTSTKVLDGDIANDENYKRFAVTPGGSPIEKIWYIDSNGKLTQVSP